MSLAKGTIRAAFGEGESGMNPRRQAETAPTAGDGPRGSRREGDGGNKKTPKANNLPCITLNADSLNSTWAVLDSMDPIVVGHLWPLTSTTPIILVTALLTLLLMPSLSTRLGISLLPR